MAKDFIKTWDKRRLEDWGSVVSKEYKSFQRCMKNEVERLCKAEGARLVSYNSGHYYQSGFVERDGMYVYFCYESLDRCYVELTDGRPFYMRTASGPKDYHGGSNNNVTFSQFSETLRKLFREQARKRQAEHNGCWTLDYVSSEGFKFELLLFDWGVHVRVSKDGVLLYHNEMWEPFNTSYDIYEASRQRMLDETSDIYKMLRGRYERELRQAA